MSIAEHRRPVLPARRKLWKSALRLPALAREGLVSWNDETHPTSTRSAHTVDSPPQHIPVLADGRGHSVFGPQVVDAEEGAAAALILQTRAAYGHFQPKASLLRTTMSRSSQRSHDAQASLGMDQEIALLLAAIEEERVPDRLTRLAIELQNALVESRRRETTN